MSFQQSVQYNFDIQTKCVYVDSESRPDQGYYFFVYKISITNKGNAPAQLMSRHWIITDAMGNVEEVRGPGVVGLQPQIQPGQTFEYESASHLSTSTGSMKGFYEFSGTDGTSFQVEIPEFYLIEPRSLH
jgi:ApaG protein